MCPIIVPYFFGNNFRKRLSFTGIFFIMNKNIAWEVFMSEFSEYCKYCIKSCGTNIYQISKSSGLDRTTLQRTVNGTRLPGEEFIETLSRYLRLSPAEKKQLITLYQVEKIGRPVYENRLYIKYFLTQIDAIQSEIAEPGILNALVANNTETYEGTAPQMLSRPTQVKAALSYLIGYEFAEEENPTFLMNIVFEDSYIYELLIRQNHNCKKEVRIHHLLTLNKNTYRDESDSYNLKMVKNILPYALHFTNSYNAYYCYSNNTTEHGLSTLFPCFIITKHHVLVMEPEYRMGILYHDDATVEAYTIGFNHLKANYMPFISQDYARLESLNIFVSLMASSGPLTYALDSQPCVTSMVNPQVISKLIHPDIPDQENFIKLIGEWYDYLMSPENCSPKTPVFYFPLNGLWYFAETGKLSGQLAAFTVDIGPEMRVQMLKQILANNENGRMKTIIIDHEQMTLPSFFTLECHNQDHLILTSLDPRHPLSIIDFQEPSIGEAFYDFLESLQKSSVTFSHEKSLELIRDAIKMIEQ